IKCRAGGGRACVFGIKNPLGFESVGINFTDPDFDIVAVIGGGANRIGTYGFLFYATAPYSEDSLCGEIEVYGDAINCMGLVITDATTQLGVVDGVFRAIRDITVKGSVDTEYYGVSNLYGATDVNVQLHCRDVRRGFIVYGSHGANVDISL